MCNWKIGDKRSSFKVPFYINSLCFFSLRSFAKIVDAERGKSVNEILSNFNYSPFLETPALHGQFPYLNTVELSRLFKLYPRAAFDNRDIRHNTRRLASASTLNAGRKVHGVASRMKIWTPLDSAANLIYHGATYHILTRSWYTVIHCYLYAAKNNAATSRKP